MFQEWLIPISMMIAAIVLLRLGRRTINWAWTRPDRTSNDFDLSDLQKLVANGSMTQEEYLKARDVILSRSDARHEPAKGFPVMAPREAVRGFPVLPPPDQNEPPKTQ
jgi:hypothetical protein